jgi:hypothetical protein
MKNIQGRIIRIVDKNTVIVNLGTEDGITFSTIFSIMGEPEQIIDPENNEVLGEVYIVKARVKAKTVTEKFTIATTKWADIRLDALGGSFDSSSGALENVEKDQGELLVEEADLQPWKAKSESPVKVGDTAEALVENYHSPSSAQTGEGAKEKGTGTEKE